MKNLSTHIMLLFIAVFALSSSGAVMAMEWKIHDTLLEEVERGETRLVQALLKSGDAERKDIVGCTLLLAAATEGHKELVQVMLAEGADARVKNNDSTSLLHWVARRGWTDLAEKLVAEGAEVTATNDFGATALYMVMEMYQRGAHDEGFRVDLMEFVDLIELLLAKGAKVNARTTLYGRTPLLYAVEIGAPEAVIRKLLSAGADASIENTDGKKPADFARSDAIRELLKDK